MRLRGASEQRCPMGMRGCREGFSSEKGGLANLRGRISSEDGEADKVTQDERMGQKKQQHDCSQLRRTSFKDDG